jgi:thiamine kinase-like enzyme
LVYGVKAHLPAFLKDLGNDLAEADQSTLKTVFNSSLAPWLRLADGRDLTVIHGDAHAWNFLFDRRGTDTPYLIDWQTWHRDVGARDLAYLIALHWDAPTRQRLERPLLRRYHQELIRSGISTYSFDDLVLDYRRCVVRNLTFPVIYWSRGFPRESWRYRLDCALAAYRDLDAAELLSREA